MWPHVTGPHSIWPPVTGLHSIWPPVTRPYSMWPPVIGPYRMWPPVTGPHSMWPHVTGPYSGRRQSWLFPANFGFILGYFGLLKTKSWLSPPMHRHIVIHCRCLPYSMWPPVTGPHSMWPHVEGPHSMWHVEGPHSMRPHVEGPDHILTIDTSLLPAGRPGDSQRGPRGFPPLIHHCQACHSPQHVLSNSLYSTVNHTLVQCSAVQCSVV